MESLIQDTAKENLGGEVVYKPASKNRLEELYKSHLLFTQTTHRG
jgi:hypothetical protein